MARRNIVVIGCSAGGVEVLSQLVSLLPEKFPATLLVVMHVAPGGLSVLPKILANAGRLPAAHAEGGESLEPGRIFVAPPDRHLVVRGDQLELERTPRQNGHRPSVDVLFRSAAYALGPRVIGMVLSGSRDDGAAGLVAVRRSGGYAMVQTPDTAMFPDMPRNAIETSGADLIAPIPDLVHALKTLVTQEAEVPKPTGASVFGSRRGRVEAQARSVFVCPECRGPLSETYDDGVLRFECRIGHAFSGETLLAEHYEAVESALWSAVNALEERAELSRRMATRTRQRGHHATAIRFEEQAEDAEQRVATLRKLLLDGLEAPPPSNGSVDEEK